MSPFSSSKEGDTINLNARDTDVVIPILGATGAGKSSFINRYLEGVGQLGRADVGESLTSCTNRLAFYAAERPDEPRVIFVDTPGFDDGIGSDFKILKRVANWVQKMYGRNRAVLGGAVYVHDISQDRLTGSSARTDMHLHSLNKQCGVPPNKVVFVTSKWSRGPTHEILVGREEELARTHWRKMVSPGGAKLTRLRAGDEAPCALEIIGSIVQEVKAERVTRAEKEGQRTSTFVRLHKKVSTLFSDARAIVHQRMYQKAPPPTGPAAWVTRADELSGSGEGPDLDEGIHRTLGRVEERLFKRVRELLVRV